MSASASAHLFMLIYPLPLVHRPKGVLQVLFPLKHYHSPHGDVIRWIFKRQINSSDSFEQFGISNINLCDADVFEYKTISCLFSNDARYQHETYSSLTSINLTTLSKVRKKYLLWSD